MAKKISEMEGMGDLIALVTEKTGIKKVVEAVVKRLLKTADATSVRRS
jgi:hypothetical protein